MEPDRADVILPAGLVLTEVVTNVIGARGLYAANVGLKDGLLAEMAGPPPELMGRDFRRNRDYQKQRWHLAISITSIWDTPNRFVYLAELLFDQLQTIHHLSSESRLLPECGDSTS